jgi:hypothetical protein
VGAHRERLQFLGFGLLLGLVLGALIGGRIPRWFGRGQPPPDPPPSVPRTLLGLNLGKALLACKPPAAELIRTPRTEPASLSEPDSESDLPFLSEVIEWEGSTDVLEVRRNFLSQLREHFRQRALHCYGPGIDPKKDHDENLAAEVFRCDTDDGVCAAS